MRDLAYWSDLGPVARTRYSRLYVWHQDRGLWRHLWADDDGDFDITLDQFASRIEALASLDATAERLGLTS